MQQLFLQQTQRARGHELFKEPPWEMFQGSRLLPSEPRALETGAICLRKPFICLLCWWEWNVTKQCYRRLYSQLWWASRRLNLFYIYLPELPIRFVTNMYNYASYLCCKSSWIGRKTCHVFKPTFTFQANYLSVLWLLPCWSFFHPCKMPSSFLPHGLCICYPLSFKTLFLQIFPRLAPSCHSFFLLKWPFLIAQNLSVPFCLIFILAQSQPGL